MTNKKPCPLTSSLSSTDSYHFQSPCNRGYPVIWSKVLVKFEAYRHKGTKFRKFGCNLNIGTLPIRIIEIGSYNI